MKHKILNIILFLLIVAVSSCINYTQVTTIRTDNSGKMYIHYWMKMDPDLDSLLLTKLGLFNEDSLQSIFNANFTELNYTRVFHDFGDSSLHAQIEFEFTNFDSLNLLQFFKHSELSVKEGPEDTKIFSQFIQPITTSFGFYNKNLTISYVYYLPGEIISHNANTHFRNKLTWIFDLDNIGTGKTITANYIPFKLKETPIWIYILAGLVIIIVLIFLLKKSRN
ncbi:MAG: hypothetical protein KDC88_00075 [Ignavibacteriae bacterium]|nr:hypothetical protein [Ignavibacteriota bacterium]MCB9210098.1 hypothetical protein [Ignavibacteriales bacterium]MCB9218517.1 hypothetical protein [Ignavibacteriales bacterium]MCB9259477.1 hypothetical protein [Ignavibacteriales bacterium]